MLSFISVIHILTCVFIVLFVLLQDPKGGVLGNLGGGAGGKSLFGSQGAGGFLVQAVKWLAVVFALTSISLSYISAQKNKSSLMEESVNSLQDPEQDPKEAPAKAPEGKPPQTPLKSPPSEGAPPSKPPDPSLAPSSDKSGGKGNKAAPLKETAPPPPKN